MCGAFRTRVVSPHSRLSSRPFPRPKKEPAMKRPSHRNRPTLLTVAAIAGFAIGAAMPFTSEARAQEQPKKEGRRSRTKQEAKPVELNPAQVAELAKLANDRK